MKFEKIVNRIKKEKYDVSIASALFKDIDNIEYGVFDSNSICIYSYDNEVIKNIEKIVKNMNCRAVSRKTSKFAPSEIFIY